MVDHDFYVTLGLKDPWSAIGMIEADLLWGVGSQRPTPGQRVGLSLYGLTQCPDAEQDLRLFVASVQHGAKVARESAPPAPANLSREAVARLADAPLGELENALDRQLQIWTVVGSLWTGLHSGHENEVHPNWSLELNRQTIRLLEEATAINDVLAVVSPPRTSGAATVSQSTVVHATPTSVSDDLGVIFVHGLFSSPSAWDKLEPLVASLPGVSTYRFGYDTPKLPRFGRRVASHDDIADQLATFVGTQVKERQIAFVTHSQGGHVAMHLIERYLLNSPPGGELPHLNFLLMYACPNAGSAFGGTVRRALLGWNRQEKALRPLDPHTAEVVRRVLIAVSQASPPQLDMDVVAVVGTSDGVVLPASARGSWPLVETVRGDHGSIIRPTSRDDDSYRVLERHIRRFTPVPASATQGAEGAMATPREFWERRVADVAAQLPFDDWTTTYRGLVGASIWIHQNDLESLRAFATWDLASNYPAGEFELRRAIQTMGQVAGDLIDLLDTRLEIRASHKHENWLMVPQWYKLPPFNARYDEDLAEYEAYRDLIGDLCFELTRAAEWFGDVVRERIDPTFRLHSGGLILEAGPFESTGETRRFRVSYSAEQRREHPSPYPGLPTFKTTTRYERDLYTIPER